MAKPKVLAHTGQPYTAPPAGGERLGCWVCEPRVEATARPPNALPASAPLYRYVALKWVSRVGWVSQPDHLWTAIWHLRVSPAPSQAPSHRGVVICITLVTTQKWVVPLLSLSSVSRKVLRGWDYLCLSPWFLTFRIQPEKLPYLLIEIILINYHLKVCCGPIGVLMVSVKHTSFWNLRTTVGLCFYVKN